MGRERREKKITIYLQKRILKKERIMLGFFLTFFKEAALFKETLVFLKRLKLLKEFFLVSVIFFFCFAKVHVWRFSVGFHDTKQFLST